MHFLQTHTGLAKGEAIVVTTISVLLVGGWVGNRLFPRHGTHDVATTQRVIALLDSIQQHMSADPTLECAPALTVERPTTAPSEKPKEKAAVRVAVNTASKAQLERLPGVGPAMAERIIEERKRRPFTNPDDLDRVKGIGAKKLEKMRPYIIAP